MFGGAVCVHFEARRAGRQPQPEYRRYDLFSLIFLPPIPPPQCNVGVSFLAPIFLSRCSVLVSTLHKGEGGAWRHLGGLGRINHVYRIRGQGFGKNVGGGDSKVSIIKLLHGGCSSAAYPPAGQHWPRFLLSFWSLLRMCMFKGFQT